MRRRERPKCFSILYDQALMALNGEVLPSYHRDPFDRMLVAQALVDGVPIVTGDPRIGRYGVQTIW
jgi:PIN domain nuclease of toxin-antitoxin system